MRKMSTEALREFGYTAVHSSSAIQALKILGDREDIILLFTDIVMPEVNGKKLADKAVRRRPELKVLYTTGYTHNAIVHRRRTRSGGPINIETFHPRAARE